MNKEPEFEEGVCVACKAAAQIVFDPDGINAPVCLECKGDGSFVEWLTNELERLAPEMGMVPCGKTPDGKRNLWKQGPP